MYALDIHVPQNSVFIFFRLAPCSVFYLQSYALSVGIKSSLAFYLVYFQISSLIRPIKSNLKMLSSLSWLF